MLLYLKLCCFTTTYIVIKLVYAVCLGWYHAHGARTLLAAYEGYLNVLMRTPFQASGIFQDTDSVHRILIHVLFLHPIHILPTKKCYAYDLYLSPRCRGRLSQSHGIHNRPYLI